MRYVKEWEAYFAAVENTDAILRKFGDGDEFVEALNKEKILYEVWEDMEYEPVLIDEY